MPNIKSAKKRVKVNAKKAAANKAANSALKTAIKKANVAIETNAAATFAILSSMYFIIRMYTDFCIALQSISSTIYIILQ